jgi:nucleoside-diphosphate-sugar epimerase
VTIVRPGWIYGPRDAGSFARIARMIEHHQLFMIGSGANRLPLIFVRDAARGAILASHAPAADGRAYLLVNDEPVTQRDFICAIATHLGVPAPRRKIPYDLALMVSGVAEDVARLARRRQPPPVTRYGMQMLGGDNRFNIARAKRELGFSPEVGLAEGVRRSVEWYRATYGVSTAWSACA